MTQPHPSRPVPGPPRSAGPSSERPTGSVPEVFAALAELPVAEHVAVFEAEHDRLRRELSTIDQL